MGFFSWCCAKCSQPVLNFYAVSPDTRALCEVIVLTKKGVTAGIYDGYGRVDDYEIPCGVDPVMLHRCCYSGERFQDLPASQPDPGQGYFHGDQDIQRIHEAVKAFCAARSAGRRPPTSRRQPRR